MKASTNEVHIMSQLDLAQNESSKRSNKWLASYGKLKLFVEENRRLPSITVKSEAPMATWFYVQKRVAKEQSDKKTEVGLTKSNLSLFSSLVLLIESYKNDKWQKNFNAVSLYAKDHGVCHRRLVLLVNGFYLSSLSLNEKKESASQRKKLN
jgi:hypothetical protein